MEKPELPEWLHNTKRMMEVLEDVEGQPVANMEVEVWLVLEST